MYSAYICVLLPVSHVLAHAGQFLLRYWSVQKFLGFFVLSCLEILILYSEAIKLSQLVHVQCWNNLMIMMQHLNKWLIFTLLCGFVSFLVGQSPQMT